MKRTCALACLIVLSGCAFSAVRRVNFDQYGNSYRTTKHIELEPTEALDEARSALDGIGWEIASTNADLGIIHSKPRPVTLPDVCDCGTWNGDPVHGTGDFAFVVSVTPDGTGAKVTVDGQCMTNFTGQNLYGATTRRETYRCASRGKPENDFWTTLETVAANRAARKAKG